MTLRPDLATGAVAGHESITLAIAGAPLAELAFSPNALAITDARIEGMGPVAVERDADALRFVLDRPLKGRVTLRFAFAGQPARGLLRVPGGLAASYFACDWMVCRQDVPGDKARLALDLLLPQGASAEAIGPGRRTPAGGGLVRHRFASRTAFSPYLYGFVAGRFARAERRTPQGRLILLDATGGAMAAIDREAVMTQSAQVAAFLAGKAGLPLPGGRTVLALVPGGEAQESAGYALIGADHIRDEREAPQDAWVVAHEMAHQWWGNALTCESWREFWLNEGFATFMTAAWKEHRFGRQAYRAELDRQRDRLGRARQAGFDKPLEWDGRYPSLALRRAVQYGKGALFLAHLRERLGDAAFWSGIRHYTRDHVSGTVTGTDLRRALEAASRQDLADDFRTWTGRE